MRSSSNLQRADLRHGKATSVFSFFSGAGFLDLGFEDEGFGVVFANELSPEFARAYAHAREKMGRPLPDGGVAINSVEDWLEGASAGRLKAMIRREHREGHSVGFIGGPPCPDFSVGGKNRGHAGDNGRLTKTYFDLILEHQPDWFLFENVKGLWRTKRHRAFFDAQGERLSDSGFRLFVRLSNAIEYGAPQDRDRIFVVGIREKSIGRYLPMTSSRFSDESFPWHAATRYPRTILESAPWPVTTPFGSRCSCPRAIPRELTADYWFQQNAVMDHPNAGHRFTPRAGLTRFLSVAEGDVSRKSYKRLHRWRYSPTVAYGNNEVHLHPTEPRRLSVAEALALQSLPRSFVLPDDVTLSAMFKMIGNGVPYLMARGIARTIAEVIR